MHELWTLSFFPGFVLAAVTFDVTFHVTFDVRRRKVFFSRRQKSRNPHDVRNLRRKGRLETIVGGRLMANICLVPDAKVGPQCYCKAFLYEIR